MSHTHPPADLRTEPGARTVPAWVRIPSEDEKARIHEAVKLGLQMKHELNAEKNSPCKLPRWVRVATEDERARMHEAVMKR